MQEKNKEKSLAVNATLNTIKTVAGMLLSILTFPYVTRVLNVDSLGAYNFSYSIVSYAVLFAGLGTMSYAIREGTQYREDKEKLSQFVSEVFSINVISTCMSYGVLFVIMALAPQLREYRLMILILSTEIFCSTIGVSWLCNVFEDFLYITIRTLAIQVLYVIALLIFVRQPDDIYKYVVISTISNTGANILNYFYIRKKYIKFKFTFNCDWKRHLKPILVIFSTKIAITIYVNSDKTILGLMTNDLEVGLYSAAVKIYSIVKEILVAITTVLIPRFAILINTKSKKEANLFFTNVVNAMSILIVPAFVGLFIMSPEIICIIAGESYLNASSALRILSVAILFSMYANILVTCVLVPSRKENKVFIATMISAIVNILLNIVLIPLWGMNAAAFTTLIAEIVVFIMAIFVSRKLVHIVEWKRNFSSIFIGSILIVIVCCVLKRYINGVVIRLFCAIIGSAVSYGVILVAMKNKLIMEFLAKCEKLRNKT